MDEIAAARDIAEFEKNIHLRQPCSTLDGFNVSEQRVKRVLLCDARRETWGTTLTMSWAW